MTDQAMITQTPPNPVKLHPVDQERLELTGHLPNLPLLVNPALLDRLRAPPSSVHTIETSDRTPSLDVERTSPNDPDSSIPPDPHRQDYSYRGYLLRPRMDAYIRAMEIYAAVDGSFGGKFSTRLGNCRKNAWFIQHYRTGEIKVASSRCKLRWCPICRDVSRHIVTTAVDKWLKVQAYPKMITFTLQHNDDPLYLQIATLYDSFRKIRRRSIMSNNVTGGVWFFQLKHNVATDQWHPHIHCLVAGPYIPHHKLKEQWHAITKTSYIVDIRPVKDLDAASSEVARYATSPADITATDFPHALDIFYATKNRRICGAWGTARGTTLAPHPQPDSSDWEKVADFYYVSIHRSHLPHLQEFWRCFKTGDPYTGPVPQDERDVFREELAFLSEDTVDPRAHQFRFKRIVESASTFCLQSATPTEA